MHLTKFLPCWSALLFARLIIKEEPRRPAIAKSTLRGYKIDYVVLSNQKKTISTLCVGPVREQLRWCVRADGILAPTPQHSNFQRCYINSAMRECELICVCARSNLLDKRDARQRREHAAAAASAVHLVCMRLLRIASASEQWTGESYDCECVCMRAEELLGESSRV